MRYAMLVLFAIACGPSLNEEFTDELGMELLNEAEVVVKNRSFHNVIVRICEVEICRRVVEFVRAGGEDRGTFTYETDANLTMEVQYIGRDADRWRSGLLYWISPGICIEVEVRHYDMRGNNSLRRCAQEANGESG